MIFGFGKCYAVREVATKTNSDVLIAAWYDKLFDSLWLVHAATIDLGDVNLIAAIRT